jgi:hypothetical protein
MSDVLSPPITMDQLAPPVPSPDAKPLALPFPPLAVETDANTDQSRALATARSLLDRGGDPERIRAALAADGVDPDLLDDRSAAEKSHDAAFGFELRADPASFFFTLPRDFDAASKAAFNGDARQLIANLGYDPNRGNTFATSLVRAIAATSAALADRDLATSSDAALAAQGEKDEAAIRQIVGDKFDHMVGDINWLLDEAAADIKNRKFVDALRPGGIIGRQPNIFVAMATRAASVRHWIETRP